MTHVRKVMGYSIFRILSMNRHQGKQMMILRIGGEDSMDHRIFRFATRGQCNKGKKARLSFYALPSGGNRKTRWSITFAFKKYTISTFPFAFNTTLIQLDVMIGKKTRLGLFANLRKEDSSTLNE